jgi:hypothetical protein
MYESLETYHYTFCHRFHKFMGLKPKIKLLKIRTNFTGMMLRRSSTRIPLFVLIGQKKWQIYAFLFSIGQEKKSFL